ncbi:unnamed protein product [Durusdinium trenchii]|uniref:Uncharacterized protein n=1 Tax=Durusdinium trenchii TaxID=1381693 RepID=A0ABP0MYE7_9DINO
MIGALVLTWDGTSFNRFQYSWWCCTSLLVDLQHLLLRDEVSCLKLRAYKTWCSTSPGEKATRSTDGHGLLPAVPNLMSRCCVQGLGTGFSSHLGCSDRGEK